MKARSLIALAIAALAASGGAVYFTIADSQYSASDPAAGQLLYPGLTARLNDIGTITVVRKDGTLTLVRDDRGWRVAEKANYPAAFDKVRKLLVDMANMRTLEAKTSVPTVYASLDLDDLSAPEAKSAVITLKDSGGAQVASLIAGKTRSGRAGPAGDTTYVRKSGEARAWLASGRIAPEREADRWVDRRVIDLPRDRVKDATVAQADGSKLTVRRERGDTDFALVDPPADRAVKFYERNSIGGAFEVIDLDDVRPVGEVTFADAGPYIEIRTFDGVIARANLADVDGKTWAKVTARFEAPAEAPAADANPVTTKLKSAADAAKEAADINARLSGWAYRLPDYKLEPMRRKLDDLLEPKPAP